MSEEETNSLLLVKQAHQVASPKVLRLEAFVSEMLQPNLLKLYTERDVIYNQVAQCTQLRRLFDDMAALSANHNAYAANYSESDNSSNNNNNTYNNNYNNNCSTENNIDDGNKNISSTSTSLQQKERKQPSRQKNNILVDLGNHFYTPAKVINARRVHVNIGCNVILEMSTDDAKRFLHKRETLLRQIASSKTREVLQMKYRIRLVTEMITRLHERDVAGVTKETEASLQLEE